MGDKCIEWPVIGIDLGITYSCVAVWKDGRVEIIPNDQGNRTTPSCVAFSDSNRLIGEAALNQAKQNPANTIFDAKRLIGRTMSDDSVQEDIKFWPFKVEGSSKEIPMIVVNFMGEQMEFTPEEISAMVLAKMKGVAEAYLGTTVKNAIVTVPAYFNDSQRRATKDAGTIAGLNVVRIINEPTAAAMAYGLDTKINSKDNAARKNVLVFDLGGETFDVSLLAIEKGEIEFLAISGENHLGGTDFVNRMVSEFVKEFKKKHMKDISKSPRAFGRLRAAAERAKRVLSSRTQTNVQIDSLFEGIDFSSIMTRSRFDKLNMDLFRKCMETVDKCVEDANMRRSDVHDIVLVGGSSRIPKVQQMLQQMFEGKELCNNIHSDETVAYGAAVQAAILSGVVLVNFTPLSLGLENTDGKLVVIIPRNTTIPVKKNQTWIASVDNQTGVCFRVFQGERLMAKYNNFLGELRISGFPPTLKGQTKFDICFEMDGDRTLKVSAVELSTRCHNQITITNQCRRLSKEEIDRMIYDGKKYRDEDEEESKIINAKNKLKMYANSMLDALHNSAKYRIKADAREQLKDAIEQTMIWMKESSDTSKAAEFEQKLEDLEFMKLELSMQSFDIFMF